MNAVRPSSRTILIVGSAWLLVAIALGASGRLESLRPPIPQLVLIGLTLALVGAGILIGSFQTWLLSLTFRQIIAFHVTRFIGIYFLVLYARGQLPFAFAVPGGWGDIAVAVSAFVIVLFVPALGEKRRLVALWNTVGLLDILYVVITAGRLAMADPSSMSALLHLPLSLLPTFLVPLIIASHLLVYWRLRLPAT